MNKLKVVVTACLSIEKYKSRFESFLEHGLLNFSENVELVILVGKSDRFKSTDIKYPFEVFLSSSDSHIVKICEYLQHLINKEIENCWYFKIDDDSLNDIEALCNQLSRYDLNKPHFLLSRRATYWSPCDRKAIESVVSVNFEDMYHEWECAIFNGKYLELVSQYEYSRQIIKNRIACKAGFSDQILGALAHLSGVKPKVVGFITQKPLLDDFSYFGGKRCHIHYIAPDVNAELFEKFKRMKAKKEIKFI